MNEKNISRRNFLKTSGLVLGASALAACAPTTAPQPAATAVPTEAPKAYQGKVRVLSVFDSAKLPNLVSDIEAKWPGVKMDWSLFPADKYTELFAGAEVAGDQIDIMALNGQDLRRYATGNKLTDLTNIGLDLNRYRKVGLDTYSINGKLWGIPFGGITGFTFFYNKKALEKIGMKEDPVTYDDFKAVAAELKKAGIAPLTHEGKDLYVLPVWYFLTYAQTSGNKPQEFTYDVMTGKRKFTDPESVAALELIYKYLEDGLFIDSLLSLDGEGSWNAFSNAEAAFYYTHSWRIGYYRQNEKDLPNLDLGLMPPPLMVSDKNVKRQMPGGTGDPICIYAGIKPERMEISKQILDFWTRDEFLKTYNAQEGAPVSTNANVKATDDPISVKYAEQCADMQFTYLDWFWPPEVTRAVQEQIQLMLAKSAKPDAAAGEIQKAFDQAVEDGFKFEA